MSAQTSPAWAAAAYAYWQWPLLVAVAFGVCCLIGAGLCWILEARGERRYDLGDEAPAAKQPFRAAIKFNLLTTD